MGAMRKLDDKSPFGKLRNRWWIRKMAIFWVVAPCCLVEVYRRFRGAYCLHYQGGFIWLRMGSSGGIL
jgi:hypothetical protein